MTQEIPKIPEQNSDRIEYIAGAIQDIDSLSGYMAGLAAKHAVETGRINGLVTPGPDEINAANEYGVQLRDEDKVIKDSEKAIFTAARSLAESGADLTAVRRVELTNKNDLENKTPEEVVGFALGFFSNGPTYTSTEREKTLGNAFPDDTEFGRSFDDMASLLKEVLAEGTTSPQLDEAKRNELISSFPREFGLRLAIERLSKLPPEARKSLADQLTSTDQLENTSAVPEDPEFDEARHERDDKPDEIAEDIGNAVIAETVKEPEEVETDPGEINISSYFQSGEALSNALQDGELAPEVRQGLSRVVSAWQDLELSEVAKGLWEEKIKPQLEKLDEHALHEQIGQIQNLEEKIQQFTRNWTTVRDRIQYGDLEGLVGFMRQNSMGEEAIQDIENQFRKIREDESVQSAVRLLGLDTEDSEHRIGILARRADPTRVDPEKAEEIVQLLQGMGINPTQLKDVPDITQAIGEKIKFKSWRAVGSRLESVMNYSRFSANTMRDNSVMRNIRNIVDGFEEFQRLSRSGGRGADEVAHHISRAGLNMAEELSQVRIYASISKSEAAWLK